MTHAESDDTFDAAWNEVLAAIRSEGRDPEAIVARAAAKLDAWHKRPTGDADEAVNWPSTPAVTRRGVRGETFTSPPFCFDEETP